MQCRHDGAGWSGPATRHDDQPRRGDTLHDPPALHPAASPADRKRFGELACGSCLSQRLRSCDDDRRARRFRAGGLRVRCVQAPLARYQTPTRIAATAPHLGLAVAVFLP